MRVNTSVASEAESRSYSFTGLDIEVQKKVKSLFLCVIKAILSRNALQRWVLTEVFQRSFKVF